MTRVAKASLLCALTLFVGSAFAAQDKQKSDKIPITTSSEAARQLYLKGRALAEGLRATDARKYFADALAKDKSFALAALAVAQNSNTAKEFFDKLAVAVSLA